MRLLQNLNPAHWLGHSKDLEVGRKKLVKDNRDSLRMTLPFLLWGVLVIIIYAVSCKTLGSISTPLVQLDIARRAVAKVSRTLFISNELCTQVGRSLTPAMVPDVLHSLTPDVPRSAEVLACTGHHANHLHCVCACLHAS